MRKCSELSDAELLEYRGLLRSASNRAIDRKVSGIDRKFAYHVVRLLYEAEMILNEHDIDLQRHREHLKAIRRGEVSEDDVRAWASSKEADLERAYANSNLRHSPDEDALKSLLLSCLEHHYGSLSGCVAIDESKAVETLRRIARMASEF